MEPVSILVGGVIFGLTYTTTDAALRADMNSPRAASTHIEQMFAEAEGNGVTLSERVKTMCRGYQRRLFDLENSGTYTPQVGQMAAAKCADLIARNRP